MKISNFLIRRPSRNSLFASACLPIGLAFALCLSASAQYPVDRVLTDTQGRQLEARILSKSDGNIRIRRLSDGREFDLPVDQLSPGDRTWLVELENTARPASAPPAREQPAPRPAPIPARSVPEASKPIPSAEIVAAQERAGLVLPPPGWDALETILRFRDGRILDGYVYDVRDDRFWYAGNDMRQMSGELHELTNRCRLELWQWRNRIRPIDAPSMEFVMDGETIHASVIHADDDHFTLLTEGGDLLENVPQAKLAPAGKMSYWLMQSGTRPGSERPITWAIPPDNFTAAIPFFENGHALAMKEKKWGVIDPFGKWLISPRFDEIKKIPGSRNLKIRENESWGLILESGQIVAEPKWEDVGDFHHGMLPVRSNGKWGYADAKGNLRVRCEWDDAWRFSAVGTAVVIRGGKRGIVDGTGKILVRPEWDGILMHSPQGIGAVRRDKYWALIDLRGSLLTDPTLKLNWNQRRFEFGFIPASSERYGNVLLGLDGKPTRTPQVQRGVALAKLPGPFIHGVSHRRKFSIPDLSGAMIELDEIRPASGGLAAVRQGNKWGYANHRGLVVEPRWDDAGPFSEGLAAVVEFESHEMTRPRSNRSAPWQFINATGETVIPANPDRRYDLDYRIRPQTPVFKKGHVGIRDRNWKRAWIDANGNQHSEPPKYSSGIGFPFPKAADEVRLGMVDFQGNILVAPAWESLTLGDDSFLAFKKDGKWGVAGTDGRESIAPEWDAVRVSPSGLAGIRKGKNWGLAAPGNRIIVPPSVKHVHLTGNGYAIVGSGNRQQLYWPDGEILTNASDKWLIPVGEYGSDLIFYGGDRANPESCWRANYKGRQFTAYEGTIRAYWNDSLVGHDRIWLQDQTTNHWHFCSLDGKRLGPVMEAQPAQWFMDEGLGVIPDDQGQKFIDSDGNLVGQTIWQAARAFRHGMAAVQNNGKWGFIDPKGTVTIACEYDEVGDFFEAGRRNADQKPLLAAVSKDGRWGYVDPSGKLVIPLVGEQRGVWCPYGNTIYFRTEGKKNTEWPAFDAKGKPRRFHDRDPIAKRPHPLAGDWTMFRGEAGLLGLRSNSGTVVLEPEWNDITWVTPGIAAIQGRHDGGLFSPEQGWLFRDNDERRLARFRTDTGDGKLRLDSIDQNFLIIENTPRWGYARFANYDWQPFLEGEAIRPLLMTGGFTRIQMMKEFGSKWSGNRQLWWTRAKPGDSMHLALFVPESGTYLLDAQFTTAPDYGIFDLHLNEAPIMENLDLYARKVDVTGELKLGSHELNAGLNVLKVTVKDKNPMAIGEYMFGLDYIKTTRQ